MFSNGSAPQRYVDIHCHCLPGLDDGPAEMPESLALCRALVDDGMTDVLATPHQLGRFSDCNEASQVRQAVSDLNEELKNNDIPLNVIPGADVRVDERICELIEEDKVLTMADGRRYILLELPHEILIDIGPLFDDLASMRIEAVISHPERHSGLAKEPDILLEWRQYPAYLQITAGSILGYFGPAAQQFAWRLLSSGCVSLVATDCHDMDCRRPCMKAAFRRINDELGRTLARLVCIENPLRVMNGQDIAVGSTGTGTCGDSRRPKRF